MLHTRTLTPFRWQAAERLYLAGYLSYPRTESSSYPKSFDIRGTLSLLAGDSRWGSFVRDLLHAGPNKARGGFDAGDHPPITPCRNAAPYELSGDQARVYELVVRHFIASVSYDAVWLSTNVNLTVPRLDEKYAGFSLSGKKLVTPGFLAVLLHRQYGEKEKTEEGDVENDEERELPEFSQGETYPLATPSREFLTVREGVTSPPSLLTESELIGIMEKQGIGTDASIPTHIENIQKRNYAELVPGRKLKPSELGLVLAQGYHLIDSGLVLPKVRADIERECDEIAKGTKGKNEVIFKCLKMFEAKFEHFVSNIAKMDTLFGSHFTRAEDSGRAFTRCGQTGRYLQYIEGPPRRLYNRFTETVFALPMGGTVKVSGDHTQVSCERAPLCTHPFVRAPLYSRASLLTRSKLSVHLFTHSLSRTRVSCAPCRAASSSCASILSAIPSDPSRCVRSATTIRARSGGRSWRRRRSQLAMNPTTRSTPRRGSKRPLRGGGWCLTARCRICTQT